METFYLESPGMDRKDDALDYIREFRAYRSKINGTGGLDRFTDDYEGWLEKLRKAASRLPDGKKVPAKTFFLVRSSDRKIVGMINVRLALNDVLRKSGGNIGYSIRPTERRKGFNKINLYLGLKVCQAHGLETALLDTDLDNPGSWRTMEALGGVLVREEFDEEAGGTVRAYEIPVNQSLEKYAAVYEPMTAPCREG